MRKTLFALLLVVLVGCQKPNPLETQDSGAIATAISGFDRFIDDWEKRVSDGTWQKMIEDGSFEKLIPEAERGSDPKAYPAKRIAELKEARQKMIDELKRRSR